MKVSDPTLSMRAKGKTTTTVGVVAHFVFGRDTHSHLNVETAFVLSIAPVRDGEGQRQRGNPAVAPTVSAFGMSRPNMITGVASAFAYNKRDASVGSFVIVRSSPLAIPLAQKLCVGCVARSGVRLVVGPNVNASLLAFRVTLLASAILIECAVVERSDAEWGASRTLHRTLVSVHCFLRQCTLRMLEIGASPSCWLVG